MQGKPITNQQARLYMDLIETQRSRRNSRSEKHPEEDVRCLAFNVSNRRFSDAGFPLCGVKTRRTVL